VGEPAATRVRARASASNVSRARSRRCPSETAASHRTHAPQRPLPPAVPTPRRDRCLLNPKAV
jgi:hypothetical protein